LPYTLDTLCKSLYSQDMHNYLHITKKKENHMF